MKVALRQKKLKDRYSLYLDIYVEGERKYEMLKLYTSLKPKNPEEKLRNAETRRKAEIIRHRREDDIINKKYKISSKDRGVDFLDYFKKLTEDRKKSKGNYGNWDSIHKILLLYFGEKKMMLSELTEEDIQKIRDYLLNVYRTKSNLPLSQNAAVSYFNKVKACLNQAFDDKLIAERIGFRVKSIKAQETHRECLTIEEVDALIKTECGYTVLKNAFLFSVFTGLRWSDINNLKWSNIIHTSANGSSIRYTQQKTGTVQNLPIPSKALDFIGNRTDSEERVFKGLKYSAWHNLKLQQWAMRAGIARTITFHAARHSYATILLTKGADIYTVSKLLGHKHLSTTQIYAKVIDQKKIDAVNLLDG